MCSDILEEITGKKVNLFRPPYGEYSSTTVKVARKMEYQTIQWDVDSLDWKDSLSSRIFIIGSLKGQQMTNSIS